MLRRAHAKKLCTPVSPCGCIVDPDHDRHLCDEIAPSDRMVDAYVAAAQRLLEAGLTPAPSLPEMRVMWGRGSHERGLARSISERWETAA
jgi:hypothetical protein